MKKKILAVILTLAMVMALFSGCGKKDSTYFKEIKDICKITTGTQTAEFHITGQGEDFEEVPEIMKNAEGNVVVNVKMESQVVSNDRAGIKFSVRFGQESEYTEFTTLVVADKKVYLTLDPMISLVRKFDADTATELETGLAQMGISSAISIDLEQLLQALGEEYPEISEDAMQSAYAFVNAIMDAAEKNFAELEGQDGDDYTLTINGENAEKAVDGLIAFVKNDADDLIEKYKEVINNIYGENTTIAATAIEQADEIGGQLDDVAAELESEKSEIVQSIKDDKINMVSKAQVSGKEGNREGKITFESGNIPADGTEWMVNMNCTVQEGTPEISSMIPENASDITTLLITLLNQMDTGETYTELY